MKVLIVDDEPYMVEYIQKIVNWADYGFDRVLTAQGGSMALQILEKEKPDLMITDIRMPRVTGLDLARAVDEKMLPTKIIILSGYEEFDYAKQAVRYGVAEYLVKPILKDEFAEVLERMNERYFQDRQAKDSEKLSKDTVSVVRHYVEENYGRELSLDILADVVHLHPAYLSKLFKDVSGTNLSVFISDVRLQKAAEMLEHTDMKVHDIMEHVGYQKSQYFSKLFREKYGMTPKEWRNEKRN